VSVGIIGGLVGSLVVLLIGLLMPARVCPNCGAVQPKPRQPRTLKQALWGGYTCANCGCEIDRNGRKTRSS
jgi:hypothetical protein